MYDRFSNNELMELSSFEQDYPNFSILFPKDAFGIFLSHQSCDVSDMENEKGHNELIS